MQHLLPYQIALREARRKNPEYQQHALTCLGKVAAARSDRDMRATVLETAEPVIVECIAVADAQQQSEDKASDQM